MRNDDKNYAWVGICPICGQGRQVLAREKRTGTLYILCEDCESEWRHPEEARDIDRASRGAFTESIFLTREQITDHPWLSFLECSN